MDLKEKWGWIEGTHEMRNEIMDTLTDADLAFNPGGENMTLGALCRQMGEVEYSYLQSMKTFKQDWEYRHPDSGVETSLERLKAWYQSLDQEFKAVVEKLSEVDLSKSIARTGFDVPMEFQFDVYLQALLIFLGKMMIYLKAMNKPLTQKMRDWI